MILPVLPVVLISLLGAPGVGLDPATITRWSIEEPVVGQVIGIDEQGVDVRVGQAIIPVRIPWFDLRALRGTPIAYDPTRFEQIADDAWRAHARLERGDFAGAEEIYGQLEERYLWKIGPQSADVSMGLVRCRLDRQNRGDAVVPFVSWLSASRGADAQARTGIDGFDLGYGLLVDLPPIFGPDEYGRSIGEIPDAESSSQEMNEPASTRSTSRISNRQRALFGYYQLAINTPIHRTPESETILDELDALMRGVARDIGVNLVEEMVIAQTHPDAKSREGARKTLARRVRSDANTWIELWARLAIGVSLLGEPDTDSNERGVIELIHIIVRLDQINEPLAMLASQIANEYLVRTDRKQWGSELMFDARSVSVGRQSRTRIKEPNAHE